MDDEGLLMGSDELEEAFDYDPESNELD